MPERNVWMVPVVAIVAASSTSITGAARDDSADRCADDAPADDQQELLRQLGNCVVGAHDPSTIVECNGEYWVFITGRGTPSYHSKDLRTWEPGPPANTDPRPWVAEAVPAHRGNGYWVPDVIHIGDRYLMYYSASTFGKQGSAIGLATNATLDPNDPHFKWNDEGIVTQTKQGDDHNAIDPAAFHDRDGKLWLVFGSYWSGIKLIELDPKTGKQIAPDSPMHALAYAKEIEASYLYRHGDYYYLFVNHGICCRGKNSTYNIRVGRSKSITGPYLDRDGTDLMKSGGTLVVGSDGPMIGPGHAGIIVKDGKEYLSGHFYDGTTDRGTSRLFVKPLTWSEDGWPIVGKVE